MKTQELIKALRYCSNEHKTSCEGCPMYNPNSDDMFTCSSRMEAEAASRLEELEVELQAMRNAANGFKRGYEAAKAESEQHKKFAGLERLFNRGAER